MTFVLTTPKRFSRHFLSQIQWCKVKLICLLTQEYMDLSMNKWDFSNKLKRIIFVCGQTDPLILRELTITDQIWSYLTSWWPMLFFLTLPFLKLKKKMIPESSFTTVFVEVLYPIFLKEWTFSILWKKSAVLTILHEWEMKDKCEKITKW